MYYHYNYRITNKLLKKHYYGSRSSKIHPKLDLGIKYFSSFTNKEFIKDQKENPKDYKYKIIKIHSNRKNTIAYERLLHNKFKVNINQNFYNKVIQPISNKLTGNVGIVYIQSLQKYISCKDFDPSIHVFHTKNTVMIRQDNGKCKRIPKEEYYNNRDTLKNISDGMVSAISKIDGSKKSISKKEYYTGEYYCNNTGKVPVKDLYGNGYLVDVSDKKFINGELVHVSVGLVSVKNKITGQTYKVSQEEYDKDENLVGVNYGKINGNNNPKAKIIKIYDDKGELKFHCDGNFRKTCLENNLPHSVLRISHTKNGSPIYHEKPPKDEKWIKYKGWYALAE